jgi:hypothetical protein
VPTYEILYNQAFSKYGNIGDTWVVTPNLLNVARAGYKRYQNVRTPQDHHTLADFGGNFNMNDPISAMPAINFNTFTLGSTSQGYADVINENIEIKDDLSWTRGNHNVSVGLDWLRLQYLNNNMYPGSIGFSSTFTSQPLADALFGLVNSMTAQSETIQGGIQHDLFAYVQDNWRVTPKLTLNLGSATNCRSSGSSPRDTRRPSAPASNPPCSRERPAASRSSATMACSDRWCPPTSTASRRASDSPTTSSAQQRSSSAAASASSSTPSMPMSSARASPSSTRTPQNTPAGGFSVPLCNRLSLRRPRLYRATFPPFPTDTTRRIRCSHRHIRSFFPGRQLPHPYVMAMNFGFELQVGKGGVLDINYVGKLGRKLTVPVDLNPAIYDCTGAYFQANPAIYCNNATNKGGSYMQRVRYQTFNYGGQGLEDFMSIGGSSYNGLQVQYRKRINHGLAVLATYTYSRSLDIDTNGQTTTNVIPDVFNVNTEWGASDTNATHILNMGWAGTFPSSTTATPLVRECRQRMDLLRHLSGAHREPRQPDRQHRCCPDRRAAPAPGHRRGPEPASQLHARHRSAKIAGVLQHQRLRLPHQRDLQHRGPQLIPRPCLHPDHVRHRARVCNAGCARRARTSSSVPRPSTSSTPSTWPRRRPPSAAPANPNLPGQAITSCKPSQLRTSIRSPQT